MSSQPKCWAIVPAAGVGQRMASTIPKQYLKLQNRTILEHAASVLLENSNIKQLVFALHEDDKYFSQLSIQYEHNNIRQVIGGETRAHSVLNALEAIKNDVNPDEYVLVHDAARPCLSAADLQRLIDKCLQHEVGGILAAPVTDTVKQVQHCEIQKTLDRSSIWRAFTPQMFKFNILHQSIKQALTDKVSITDESSAVEYMQRQPCVVEGSASNIKITRSEDLDIAEMYLNQNSQGH